jgi:HlyD family secretion protein
LKRLQIRRIDAQLAGGTLEAQPGDDPILLSQVRSDGNARARTYQDEISQQEAARAQDEAELTAAREALDKLERTLPSYMRTASAYERLASEHLVGALDAEARRREALEHDQDRKAQAAHVVSLESSLQSQERKLAQIKSNYRSTLLGERSQLLGEVNQLAQDLRKQGFREGLLELRAPEDGVVKDVATTTLGAVVQPGVVLLTLVPKDEPLRAEVYIRNQDVGFVKEGQPVRIKLAAYPFTKYGFLEGVVKTLAADASGAGAGAKARESAPSGAATDEPSVFRAIIELRGQTLRAPGVDLPIFAGMAVQAEINEGKRTVLEYLLSPIRTIADEAGGER